MKVAEKFGELINFPDESAENVWNRMKHIVH